MSRIFFYLFFLIETFGAVAYGALNLELSNILDIKRSGGTAVGSFNTTLGDAAPSFMLSSSNQSTFNIRNSGNSNSGSWEWRSSGVLESSTTLELPLATEWSSGIITIEESLLLNNSDRFAPDSVAYLIGRYNGDYYAFRFGVWSNRERFRLYGVEVAEVTFSATVVPETNSFGLITGMLTVGVSLMRRRRCHR